MPAGYVAAAFDTTISDLSAGEGVVIPSGSRVLHSHGAANRDARHFPDPACAGQGLARLEVHAVLRALAARVRRIELTGEPVRALNNITRGFRSLPVRVVA